MGGSGAECERIWLFVCVIMARLCATFYFVMSCQISLKEIQCQK
ncbi:hypothetical protein [Campylobacter troglodytis]|nr:hypothetical protein [Campylobacter troglodytis]